MRFFAKSVAGILGLLLSFSDISVLPNISMGAFPVAAAENEARKRTRSEAHSVEGLKALQRATTHIDNKDYDSAVVELTNVIGDPGSYKGVDVAVAYKFRGHAYADDKKYLLAISDFTAALEHPSIPYFSKSELLSYISVMHVEMGNLSEARKFFNLGMEESEEITDQQRFAGVRLLIMEGEALEAYQETIKTKIGGLFDKDYWAGLDEAAGPSLESQIRSISSMALDERLAAIDDLFDELVRHAIPDRSAVPLVKIPPLYPKDAVKAKIEGYVIARFDVSSSGSVINFTIKESSPPGVFDAAVLEVLPKWRFRPKTLDGVTQGQTGLEETFTFSLK